MEKWDRLFHLYTNDSFSESDKLFWEVHLQKLNEF